MPSETELENLVVRLKGDGSGYKRMMEEARSQTNLTDGHIQIATKRINAMGLTLRGYGAQAAAMILPVVGAAGLLGSAFKSINLARQDEMDRSNMGVMLQSKEKGNILISQIQQMAAETPLGSADINKAAQSLLQFNVQAGDVIPTLRMLGDVAMGDAFKMQHLAVIFGQIKQAGRLMGGDLLQLVGMGFNPLEQMSKSTGKSVAQLREDMEHGLITFQMVKDAFKAATSEGGRFKDGMLEASRTLTGLLSTMGDDIDAFLREAGKELMSGLNMKGFVAEVSSLAQQALAWFKDLNPETRKFLIGMVAGTAAVVALTAAIVVAGIAFNTLFGGIGLILGAVTAVVAGIGAWIMSVGGVEEAWKLVKRAALDFWHWFEPIGEQLGNIWTAMVDLGKEAWENVKQSAIEAWKYIFGETVISWTKVREFILMVLYSVEFGLKNLGSVAAASWAVIAYEGVRAFNQLIFVAANFKSMMKNAVLGKDMMDGLVRVPGQLEEELRKEAEVLSKVLGDEFDRFLEKIMNRVKTVAQPFLFGVFPAIMQGIQAAMLGGEEKLEQQILKTNKALHARDNVLSGSAEHLRRMQDQEFAMARHGEKPDGWKPPNVPHRAGPARELVPGVAGRFFDGNVPPEVVVIKPEGDDRWGPNAHPEVPVLNGIKDILQEMKEIGGALPANL